MDKKTLAALKASIKHWEGNAKARKIGDVKLGSSECALCSLFINRLPGCRGCPVAAAGYQACNGSPYFAAVLAAGEWRYGSRDKRRLAKAFRAAARKELAFLKSLLPGAKP